VCETSQSDRKIAVKSKRTFFSLVGQEGSDYLVQNSANSRDTTNRPTGAVAEELAAAQGAAQVILEGDLVNLNVTSPAATIALGLMHLQANEMRIADMFFIPGRRM